jgi:tetratricopeptide (TPR) repeat protein
VRAVVVELNELISQVKSDHKIQKQIEEPFSINFFTTTAGAGQSTTGVNGQFVFSQILIDCLLRLKSTETDRNELIDLCEKEYEGNRIELKNLREFQRDYSSDKVLWWYTRESFFYKTLNAALRTQNIHIIFLFRSFISDIHRQLQKYQSQNVLRVYRSQMMSNDELNTLKQCIGHFISVNSFFSTSTDYQKALSFLDASGTSCDLKRVLFQIDADPKRITSKPFADIHEHSEFLDESEVLFMLGSIFRLESINSNDDRIWIVQMTLCNDDEHDLQPVLLYIKRRIGNGDINLATLGKVLRKMGKFDLAQKYFNRLLDELPSDDPLLCNLYDDLGELASLREDYDMMVKWHQKSLAFKQEYHLITNSNTYKADNSLGKSIEKESIVRSIERYNQYHQVKIEPHLIFIFPIRSDLLFFELLIYILYSSVNG